jgi:hypothetical protein
MHFAELGRCSPARGLVVSIAVSLLIAVGARGQEPPDLPSLAPSSEPGSELTIFHVTMGPGDQVYEKFEHNALWVRDRERGTDYVYNYGMFDFEQPGYWGRFVRGDWLYWLGVSEIETTLYVYRYLNRTVTAQELELTPAQRAELRDFLVWNASEQNRFYYYDYFLDNCSTRVRDALDRVLGGALRAATADSLTGTSFRWHSERLVADDFATYTGLHLGLGPMADREITGWEEMFLPGKVHEQLRRLEIPDGAGGTTPLVREEFVLYEAVARDPLRSEPPDRRGIFLLVGVLIGGGFAGIAAVARYRRPAAWLLAASTGLWAAFVGTGGMLLFGLWAFTNHVAAHRNENLLQFNPLMLGLVVLVPALVFGARWAVRPAWLLSLALLILSAVGLALKLLPGFSQANGELIALSLPAHAGMVAAVLILTAAARREPASPSPAPPRKRPEPAAAR